MRRPDLARRWERRCRQAAAHALVELVTSKYTRFDVFDGPMIVTMLYIFRSIVSGMSSCSVMVYPG